MSAHKAAGSKDRRVDKMLASGGYNTNDIYYSPISEWLAIVFFILLNICIPLVAFIATSYHSLWVLFYVTIAYLTIAKQNNSFALFEDQLIVINPNFPFRKLTIYENRNIHTVTMDATKFGWSMLFPGSGGHYVLIETNDQIHKYHCSGLDLEPYEDTSEKTIDELSERLQEKGVVVDFRIG